MDYRQTIAVAGLVTTITVAAAGGVLLAGQGSEPPLIAGGQFQASGLVAVPGTQGVLFVDDSIAQQIFWMEPSADGGQVGVAKAIALGANVVDMEGITASKTHYYVVGSQSQATGTDGDGLVRFRFDPTSRRITGVEGIRGLKAWLLANVPELRGSEGRSGDDAMNIEGLAWDPAGQRLLLGLLSPTVNGQALIIPISPIDPAGALSTLNWRVDGGKVIHLALGGRGIRGLEYDESAKTFLIIAAESDRRDARLVEWNGQSPGTLRELATFPKHLKPEGVARVNLRGRSMRMVVFDTGRFTLVN